MGASLKILAGLMGHEWRGYRRSPVWLVGLAGAVLLAVSESRAWGVAGWPSANQVVRAFQLAVSLVMGLVAFLLVAGSVTRDLQEGRCELLFSRPMPLGLYVAGKFLAAFVFALALVGLLLLVCLSRPWWEGAWILYDLRPFALIMGLNVVPMLSYTCALAVFLSAVGRRLILVLPVFLLYFLWALGTPSPASAVRIDWFEFTMRLYPKTVVIRSPVELHDYNFAHLLDPVAPGLLWRSVFYLALSALLLAGAGWVLRRRQGASRGGWGGVGLGRFGLRWGRVKPDRLEGREAARQGEGV